MENRKYVRKSFLIHQYEEEEVFLSNMRVKGWRFVNLYRGIPTKYEFEKCEPEEYVYQLDYVETDKDTEDYHQLFKDSGWEEIMPWNAIGGKWYYFCKKSNTKVERIYTDIDSKIQLLNTLWKMHSVFLLICCFLEINAVWTFLNIMSQQGAFSISWVLAMVGIVFCTGGIIFIIYIIGAIFSRKTKLEKQRENQV